MKLRIIAATFLLVAVSPAYADGEIDKAIWMGNASERINRTNNPAEWYNLKLVANLYVKDQQKVDEANARETFNWFRWRAETAKKNYVEGIPSDELEYANTTYDLLKASGSPTLKVVGTLLQYEAKKIANSPEQQLTRWQAYNQNFYNMYATKDVDEKQVLSRIYDLGAKDPTFARVFDEVFGVPLLNAKLGDTANKILSNNPDFARNEQIAQLANSESQNGVKIEKLKVAVLAKVDSIGKSLSDVKQSQQDLSTEVREYFTATQRAQLQGQRDAFEQRGLRSSILILSYLMPDQHSARQISAVGNAMLDFYTVTKQYQALYGNYASTNKTTQEASNVGTAAAAMNYVAIFFTLAEAMSEHDQGPTPEQIILDQIQQLAKLMSAFQEENRKRFDRIDETLATMFAETTAQLNALSAQISANAFNIDNVRGAVASILVKLDQVEARLSDYLRLIADQPFGHAMTSCLGHKSVTGSELSEKEYDNCVFSILSFAEEARTPPMSGSPNAQPVVSSMNDWAASINSVLALASERGSYPSIRTLPNPIRWARGASAFSTLALENEVFFQKKPSSALDTIRGEGTALNDTLSKLAPGNPEKYVKLIKSLLKEHKEAVEAVWQTAADLKAQTVRNAGGTITWLNPDELRRLVRAKLPEYSKRDINFAGSWSVIETEWPTQISGSWDFAKKYARGQGAKLEKLAGADSVWRILAEDPLLFAPELLGSAVLYPRYFVDVHDAILGVGGPWYVVDGEPLVTIFAYYVKPGEITPTTGKAVAYVPYLKGPRIMMATGICDGPGYGAQTICRDLVMVDLGRSGVVSRFDWDKFLASNSSYSNHPIIRSPALKDQVDSRLDELLVAQQQALLTEIRREDSALYRATGRLNEVVSTIRALAALTLPRPLYDSDKLRSALFGREDVSKCLFTGSRSDGLAASSPTDLPKKDAVTLLGNLDRPSSSKSSADQDTKECPKDDLNSSGALLNRQSIETMLLGSLNSKGEVVSVQINQSTLLGNIKEFAQTASEELLRTFANATETSARTNEHVFIRHELERLKTVKASLEAASP